MNSQPMAGNHDSCVDLQHPQMRAVSASIRLAALTESSDDAIFSRDLSGVITSWNKGAEKIFGYSSSEMLGTSITRLIPPERLPEEEQILDKIKLDQSIVLFETLRLAKDGRIVDVSITASAVKDSTGKIIGMSKVERDVTERKKVESYLRLQSSALQAAANAIVITDSKGVIEWANAAFANISGYSIAESVGMNPRFLKSGKHSGDFYRNLWETITSRRVWHGEIINRRKDGSLYDEEMTITPIEDPEGEIVHFIAIKQDITERKRAEQALHESHQFIEAILEVMPVRVFWKDMNLDFLGCNALFARDAGFTDPQDLIGKDDFQMVWHDQAEMYRRDDRQVIQSGCSKLLIEEEQTSPEGNILTMLSSKVPLRDSKGEIYGVLGTYMDITERKRVDEILKSLYLQLIQADKMDIIGRMAAGVAHEVKNPLQILLMYLDYLSRRMEVAHDAELDAVIKDMRLATKRADLIICELLDFARSDALELQPRDINALIEKALTLVRHNLVSSRIKLETELAPGLPLLALDSVKIEQVFVNLFTNATDAMPAGGTLTVKTSLKTLTETYRDPGSREAAHFYAGDDVVLVEVLDTGSGIVPEVLHKIFDPFFTTKATGKGTGLGLSIVKRILDLHDGNIEISNRQEGGTHCQLMLKPRGANQSAAR
ncbi:MAG: PAS domain S-box protein [Verrucomicrobiota bacterium]